MEEEKREREEEERRAKEEQMRKLREEKLLARQKEAQRRMEVEQMKSLIKMADKHYHRTLLLKRGLAPWKQFVQDMNSLRDLADSRYQTNTIKWAWSVWEGTVRIRERTREKKVEVFSRHRILRSTYKSWRLVSFTCTLCIIHNYVYIINLWEMCF